MNDAMLAGTAQSCILTKSRPETTYLIFRNMVSFSESHKKYMNKFWFSHKTNSQIIQDLWADFSTDSVWWFRKFDWTKSCQNASLCIAQEIRYRRHEVWLIQLTKTLNFTRLELLCTYNLCMLYLNCSPLVAIETCLDDMKRVSYISDQNYS